MAGVGADVARGDWTEALVGCDGWDGVDSDGLRVDSDGVIRCDRRVRLHRLFTEIYSVSKD